ncbi:diguanylate cyclase [Marinobacter sp. C2H3]|uniref:diguanylate cyclase n=1 Tax=Marinobacter sp. C2H3 TaxID=3119003 RepID=UPI00300F6602
MASPDRIDIATKLASLRQQFLARLDDDLQALAADIHAVETAQQPAALAGAYHRLHRLAGSAGTFGLPSLGAVARDCEKRLKPLAELDEAPSSAQWSALVLDLRACLLELARLAQDARDGLGPAMTAPSASPEMPHAPRQADVLIVETGDGLSTQLTEGLTRFGIGSVSVPLAELPACLETTTFSEALAVVVAASALTRARQALMAAAPGLDGVPIFAVGGPDDFDTRYRLAEHGALAFFPDPVQIPELVDRLERLSMERAREYQGRVLLVEDDPVLAEHYRVVLADAGIKLRVLARPAELLDQLAAFQPDLVLLDMQLGSHSGVHLARLIRFDARWQSLPITFLSSEDDLDVQLDALSRGADDFLTKPIADHFLVRAVRLRCQRARQLSELMNRDSLTGLLKHSMIKQGLNREAERCRRDGGSGCVVILDLDHFKQVNDTWGHQAGDTVIKALANLLRNRLRSTDLIGRYGGEEFVVVMTACGLAEARPVIQAIVDGFANLEFRVGESRFHVTVSAGLAPLDGFASGERALAAADAALYHRKRHGRNGMTVYQPDMNSPGAEP